MVKVGWWIIAVKSLVYLFDSDIHPVCSPSAVNLAGAAAVLRSFPQEVAGVPVRQCFL